MHQNATGDFTLAQVATLGLPPGKYAVQIVDVEGGKSQSDNPKIAFKAKVVQSENPRVAAGATQVWSYTWQQEWVSILTNDLIRAGLPRDFKGNSDAQVMAQRLAAVMQGQFYWISVTEQKKDPTRTNTAFAGPYAAGAASTPTAAPSVMAAPAPSGPASVPASAPQPSAPPSATIAAASLNPPNAPLPVTVTSSLPLALTPPAPPEPGLDAPLLQTIMGGGRPGLNSTQLAQLKAALPAIAAEYEAPAAAPVPAPAAAAAPVPAAAATAFQAV